jgi:hypothetical protein
VEAEELFGGPAHPLVAHAAMVLPPAVVAAPVVAAAGVSAIPVLARRRPAVPARTPPAGAVGVSLVAGAGGTWTIVEVGSGATATWEPVGEDGG